MAPRGQGTIAKIGGIPILASSIVRWALTDGVKPFYATLDLTVSDANTALEKPLVDLELKPKTGQGNTAKNVYILKKAAGKDPAIVKVVVADVRWLWSYGHLCRRYNWRRHIGHRRAKDPISAPELLDVLPDVYYAPWSLKGENRPYTGEEVLVEILKELVKIEETFNGLTRAWVIDPTIRAKLADFPIDNLQVDESADMALGRLLGYLPQAACTIDLDGTIRIYSRASGGEVALLDDLGPPVADEGTVVEVKQFRLRPKEVHFLYTREIEVRFDAIEIGGGYGSPNRSHDDRYMENVLAIPDFTLTLTNGITLPQGAWALVGAAFNAWGGPVGGLVMSKEVVERGMVPYFDSWGGFRVLGLNQPDADWASRVAATQHHYRQTYRINRRWMDRIYSLKAYRHATIDPETGTRAPAIAYSNFCYLGSQRSMASQSKAGIEESYANNVLGRPGTDPLDPITSEWHPAPARVSVIDEDQGILHLAYSVDPTRMFEMVLPAMVEIEGQGAAAGGYPLVSGPSGVIRNAASHLTFDSVSDINKTAVPKLTSSHAVTVILTAIPGVPNDDRQLHRLIRKPADVAHLVPGGVIPDALGPIMEVRVGGAFETARIVWTDKAEDRIEIEKAFGLHGKSLPRLDHLCVNQGTTKEGASLDAITDAGAARVYAMFQDRHQGTKTGTMKPMGMAGWTEEISHELMPGGELFTRIELPEQIPPMNLLSLLDSSARAMILKLPQPGRG